MKTCAGRSLVLVAGLLAPAPVARAQGVLAPAPAASAPAAAPAAPGMTMVTGTLPVGFDRATLPDLNIEGAYGTSVGPHARGVAFVRARVGVLLIRDLTYLAVGPTYEYGTFGRHTLGLQGEYLQIDTGLWGQLGALLDTHGRPGAMLSLGWSLLGVEGQVRGVAEHGATVTIQAKLRLPVSVLAHFL